MKTPARLKNLCAELRDKHELSKRTKVFSKLCNGFSNEHKECGTERKSECLEAMETEYQAGLAKGMSEKDALRLTTIHARDHHHGVKLLLPKYMERG
jgi:hypothetical protein